LTSRTPIYTLIALATLAASLAGQIKPGPAPTGQTKKEMEDQRIELLRGLTAEYATARTYIPRSRTPLLVDATDGYWNQKGWQEIGAEMGPAARTGDLVQITKETIEKGEILIELNNGIKGQRGHWYDQSGGITDTVTPAPGGTTLVVHFPGGLAGVTSVDVKKALSGVLNFNQRTVTQEYTENLPPEIKEAIQNKKAIVGMTRDELLLAMGPPIRKSRESLDGVDLEDWQYGNPPGRVTFVTLKGSKVVKVKDSYANLGGSVSDPSHPPN
jgi:hypothetical protein